MAAPPDAKSIKKWEDAFQHPIPVVRALERQLQTELSANKEQLRGLVGESYRDLLRTAERIIDMDVAAQKVEANLSETSRNCNSRLLERKARNLKIFEERVGAAEREKYVFAAQLAVLQSCPSVVSRLLHKDKGASCLLATKIFVVARLLLKSLLQKGSVPLLESLKLQRATLNTLLAHHIDLLLSTPSLSTDHLITAFTSFSLLKTSSPAEALRHFLFIRSSAISSLAEVQLPEAILKALELYNQTLQDAETVFPKRLSDSLVVLKSRSLLTDPDLLDVTELGLDVNGRWFPDEISGFVPWVRHDDLERSRVLELVKAWAERELGTLNTSLDKSAAGINDIEALVKLRSDLLDLWRAGRKGRRQFIQDGERFREAVGDRMVEVLKRKSAALQKVGKKITDITHSLNSDSADSTSLWSPELLAMEFTNGGFAFKEVVQSRVHGKNSSVKAFREDYNTWLSDITESALTIRALRNPGPSEQDDDDDFDVEEEKLQEGLEDSAIAEKEMTAALDSDYKELERTIDRLVDACDEERDGEEHKVTTIRATFLLRVIRQIRQHPPKREEDVLLHLNWFGLFLIPRLHSIVATGVGKKPFESVSKLLNQRKWSGKLASKALWEGSPPLPVQPSPLVFKFLHDLVTDMHAAGDDVWTPAAVKYIKVLACQELWGALESVLAGREIGEAVTNGNSNGAVEKQEVRETVKAVGGVGVERMNGNGTGYREFHGADHDEDHEGYHQEYHGDYHEEYHGEYHGEYHEDDHDDDHEESHHDEVTQNGKSKDEQHYEPETAKEEVRVNGDMHKKMIGMDWAIQLLFDALYLDEALQRKGSNSRNSGISSLAGKIEAAVGIRLGFDEELRRRLEGSAREYWKRTCLLFGLLA